MARSLLTSCSAALALAASLATGCGGEALPGAGTGGGGSSVCNKLEAETGEIQGSVEVAGSTRSFVAFVPEAATTTSLSLVLAYHGDGGSGKSLQSAIKLEEHTGGEAIVIYPDAAGGSFQLEDENADVLFFDALVARFEGSHCSNGRVFATGFSRGGYFANHLACYRGDRLTGIAPNSGGGPYGAPYDSEGNLDCPSPATAAAIFHGEADDNVSPSEGDKSIAIWKRELGCSEGTSPASPSPCVRYDGCSKPLQVCKIPGLGHQVWSQAPAAIWSFFRSL